MPARRSLKFEALVVNAIRRLQAAQGSTASEIANYLSKQYNVGGTEVRRQIQLTIKRGLDYGIIQKSKRGYITCDRNIPDLEPFGSELTESFECRSRGRGRRGRSCKRKSRKRSARKGCGRKSCGRRRGLNNPDSRGSVRRTKIMRSRNRTSRARMQRSVKRAPRRLRMAAKETRNSNEGESDPTPKTNQSRRRAPSKGPVPNGGKTTGDTNNSQT